MKRILITSILTLTLTISLLYSGNLSSYDVSNNKTTVALAADNNITAGKPSLTVVSRTATTANLKVGNVSGAGGYKVYRADSLNGTYKYIGYTKTSTYQDTKLEAATSYYYKVRAYKTVNGTKLNSKYSEKVTVTPTLSKPSYIMAQAVSKDSVAVVWTSVVGAKSYNVYRSTSLKGSYKYVGNSTCNSYVDKGLESDTTYYYKVRAAKRLDGAKYFGDYSSNVSATTIEFQYDSSIIQSIIQSATPTKEPTAVPTKEPTATPTKAPTATPSKAPTATPTKAPTATPTAVPTKEPTATPTIAPVDTQEYDSSFASQVLKLVNIERAKGGLSALTMSQALIPPANKRAQEIVQSFSHTRPNGTQWSTVLDEYNVSVSTAGENLAYGYNTPELVVDGWMNSPGHRANIMNANFGRIGVGVYKDSKGTVYCTQLFSN